MKTRCQMPDAQQQIIMYRHSVSSIQDLTFSGGREHHNHSPAFHIRLRLNFTDITQFLSQVMQQFFAFFGIKHISSPKLDGSFNFISILQKFPGMTCFEFKVMVIGVRTETQLLNLNRMLLFLGFFFFLLFFVHKLTEVDHLANRRPGFWCNFYQIQPIGLGNLNSPVNGDYLMFFVRSDNSDFR